MMTAAPLTRARKTVPTPAIWVADIKALESQLANEQIPTPQCETWGIGDTEIIFFSSSSSFGRARGRWTQLEDISALVRAEDLGAGIEVASSVQDRRGYGVSTIA